MSDGFVYKLFILIRFKFFNLHSLVLFFSRGQMLALKSHFYPPPLEAAQKTKYKNKKNKNWLVSKQTDINKRTQSTVIHTKKYLIPGLDSSVLNFFVLVFWLFLIGCSPTDEGRTEPVIIDKTLSLLKDKKTVEGYRASFL